VLFQYLLVMYNFSRISSHSFGLRSQLWLFFVSLVPKRSHISYNFYSIYFVHCNDTHILCQLQQVSGQTVGLLQTHFVGPDCQRFLGYYTAVESVLVFQFQLQTVVLCQFWLQCSHGITLIRLH
jgi:hypothetical protein